MTKGRTWGKVKVLLDTKVVGEIDLYQYDRRDRRSGTPFFAYDCRTWMWAHTPELRFEGRYSLVAADGQGGRCACTQADQPTAQRTDTGGGGEELLNVPREGLFEDLRHANGRESGRRYGLLTNVLDEASGAMSLSAPSAPPVDDVAPSPTSRLPGSAVSI
jgi:hypothetical protein